jgi:spore maturation protein CgeD
MTLPVSVVIVSHNKPHLVKEAIASVLAQTLPDWEAVLMDSGVLLRQGFFDDLKDPRIRIMPTNETPDMARSRNMASWCFNEAINRGLLHGELYLYLCDDDLYYPEAFRIFWEYYLGHQREPQAMYASLDIGFLNAAGKTRYVGRRYADRPAGRSCGGRGLNYEVDYLQFCHTARILERYRAAYNNQEYFSENRQHATNADGLFMEQIGALTKIWPVDRVVGMNRRAPDSINYPASTYTLLRSLAHYKLGALKHYYYVYRQKRLG